jgi:hypoxanthine-DNA glycosylase
VSDDCERLVGLPPLVDSRTRVLLVGSFPSAQSLAARQYYANPRNQFWKILNGLFGISSAVPYVERIICLLQHGVGLWDVIESCARQGSLDSAIQAPRFNDFGKLSSKAPSLAIVAFNGQKAAKGLNARVTHRALILPSSSSAHAAVSLERKIVIWRDQLAPFLFKTGYQKCK